MNMPGSGVVVSQWPKEGRRVLREVLEDSFEGWYLYHSERKLMESEIVLVASQGNLPVGLSTLELLDRETGYVFYLAVRKAFRRQGIGSILLDKALAFFSARGCARIFAAVEEDNVPSKKLFESKGFSKIDYGAMSKLFGRLRAVGMYRRMVVVPGENLMIKPLVQEKH
jgi:ribosomal protein S18 acetylase RimI-like enzyme